MKQQELDTLESRAFALAVQNHQSGAHEAAAQLYSRVLQINSDNALANHNFGTLLVDLGDPSTAQPFFDKAHRLDPRNPQFFYSLVNGLIQSDADSAAAQALDEWVRGGFSLPDYTDQINRLVTRAYERYLSYTSKNSIVPPSKAPKAILKIKKLWEAGDYETVWAEGRKFALKQPHEIFGWKAVSAAALTLGLIDEAENALEQALLIAPFDWDCLSNLGRLQLIQSKPAQSEISLRLALLINPKLASAQGNLATNLYLQSRIEEAWPAYELAISMDPDNAKMFSGLGACFSRMAKYVAADRAYFRAIEIDPQLAEPHQNRSLNLAYLSIYDEVLTESDAALRLEKYNPLTWERRLYALSYHPDMSALSIFNEFVRWGQLQPTPKINHSQHDKATNRKIKIGYISPDFRRHTSRFYFMPLFANHNLDEFETYAYSNVQIDDEFTLEFKKVFSHWRNVRQLTHEATAALIQEDGIDILIDGCNHMADDSLAVMAMKPAPVQVTWMGSAWTSGLPAIDYVMFDHNLAPVDTLATEAIVRLPDFFAAYQPPVNPKPLMPPPCLESEVFTFAYSGRSERLNHHTFRVWGKILERVKKSRLVLDFRTFSDSENQSHYIDLMQRCGLDTSRVVMQNSPDIFSTLNEFDILLDSFPHNGGTMMIDALWMGVPVVTLASRPPVGRLTSSLLAVLGMSDWTAQTEEEYVDKAVLFASKPDYLAQIRRLLRNRMLSSAFCDGKTYTRHVESAYKTMWARYCAGEAAAPIDLPQGQMPAPLVPV